MFELVELKQRHIEAVAEVIGHLGDNNAHKTRRLIIEAAIEGGWFKDKPDGEVLDWKPSKVLEVSDIIFKAYTQASEIPPA